MAKTQIPKIKDLIGKPFVRDDEYQMRVFDRALTETVKQDVVVEFGNYYELYENYAARNSRGNKWYAIPDSPNKSKVKAYCHVVQSYLQFPRDLRKPGTRCICDITSTEGDKVGGFWRYVPGTVRKEGSNLICG